MSSEQRSAKRKGLVVQVTYRVNDQERGETYNVESVNVSEDGILLRTDLPLAIGTEIQLEFSLPGNVDSVSVFGEVVWSKGFSRDGKASFTGKGIHFTHCEERCRALLAKYVES